MWPDDIRKTFPVHFAPDERGFGGGGSDEGVTDVGVGVEDDQADDEPTVEYDGETYKVPDLVTKARNHDTLVAAHTQNTQLMSKMSDILERLSSNAPAGDGRENRSGPADPGPAPNISEDPEGYQKWTEAKIAHLESEGSGRDFVTHDQLAAARSVDDVRSAAVSMAKSTVGELSEHYGIEVTPQEQQEIEERAFGSRAPAHGVKDTNLGVWRPNRRSVEDAVRAVCFDKITAATRRNGRLDVLGNERRGQRATPTTSGKSAGTGRRSKADRIQQITERLLALPASQMRREFERLPVADRDAVHSFRRQMLLEDAGE